MALEFGPRRARRRSGCGRDRRCNARTRRGGIMENTWHPRRSRSRRDLRPPRRRMVRCRVDRLATTWRRFVHLVEHDIRVLRQRRRSRDRPRTGSCRIRSDDARLSRVREQRGDLHRHDIRRFPDAGLASARCRRLPVGTKCGASQSPSGRLTRVSGWLNCSKEPSHRGGRVDSIDNDQTSRQPRASAQQSSKAFQRPAVG